jgi:hypothetical protein
LERRDGQGKIKRGRMADFVTRYLAELYQLLMVFALKYIYDHKCKTQLKGKMVQPNSRWK